MMLANYIAGRWAYDAALCAASTLGKPKVLR